MVACRVTARRSRSKDIAGRAAVKNGNIPLDIACSCAAVCIGDLAAGNACRIAADRTRTGTVSAVGVRHNAALHRDPVGISRLIPDSTGIRSVGNRTAIGIRDGLRRIRRAGLIRPRNGHGVRIGIARCARHLSAVCSTKTNTGKAAVRHARHRHAVVVRRIAELGDACIDLTAGRTRRAVIGRIGISDAVDRRIDMGDLCRAGRECAVRRQRVLEVAAYAVADQR